MRLPTAAITAAKATADSRCTAAGGAFRSKAGHCASSASAAAASVAQAPCCDLLLLAPAFGQPVRSIRSSRTYARHSVSMMLTADL